MREVKLIIYLHLMPPLRMSGAIPLLSLYIFIAWAGITLGFNFTFITAFRQLSDKIGAIL